MWFVLYFLTEALGFPIKVNKKMTGASYSEKKSSLTKISSLWAPGIYRSVCIVSKDNKIYLLGESVLLPFVSVDFDLELLLGVWLEVNGNGGGGSNNYLRLPITTNGQTIFSVFQNITNSTLILNGLEYRQNEDYIISFNNSNWQLVWTNSVILETDDSLNLNY